MPNRRFPRITTPGLIPFWSMKTKDNCSQLKAALTAAIVAGRRRCKGAKLDLGHFAMFLRRERGVGLAVLLLLLAFCPPVVAADQAYNVFAVSVPVDATAENATAARDQARADGSQRALRVLLGRLTRASDANRLPRVNSAALTDLVSGFEVANERSSGVHYVADYTFRFRPNGIRRLLQDAGVAFAETPSKPVIALPVLHDGSRAVLWDDPNPWRAAWGNRSTPLGLVPITVPIGDLPDVSAIDTQAAIRGDETAIKAISARYQNGDVLVVQATPGSGPRRLDVTATRYSPFGQGNDQTWVVSTVAKPGGSDADMMDRAVTETLRQIEESWKAANILDPSHSGTLTASAQATSLADWVAIRERLAGVPAIRSADLVSLDRGELRLTLHYLGDTNQLRLALRQRDLDLSGNDPDWRLERRGGGASPPATNGSGAALDSGPKSAAGNPSGGGLAVLRKADDQP